MPAEFLGIAATNAGSETPRAPVPPSTRSTDAFRRYDATTAEPTGVPTDGVRGRSRTHSAQWRRGLARRVVAEPEREAGTRGHRRIHLTTGPSRLEARGPHPTTGHTPLSGDEARRACPPRP
ncbi:hypothetical protein [Streptomyces sp. NPDC088766]|uniref:hypothetical protein n=1 Tax=Streptomyces sp. NPDC088766 TaxID=3365893 RepID=UPI00380FBE1C